MKYLNQWWTWSTAGGRGRKLIGFGIPAFIALMVVAAIAGGSEEETPQTAVSNPALAPNTLSDGIGVTVTASPAAATVATAVPAVAPTETPIPPTETSANVAEFIVYRDAVLEVLGPYSETLTTLGEHFGAMSNDATLLFDDNWRLQAAIHIGLLQFLGDELRAISAPDCASDVHEVLLSAIAEFDLAYGNLTTALDTIDANQVDLGLAHINAGTSLLNASSALVTANPCGA